MFKIGKVIVEDRCRVVKMLVYVQLLRKVVFILNFLFILLNCFLKNNWFIYDFMFIDIIDDIKFIYYMGLENCFVELFDFYIVNVIRDIYKEIFKFMQSLVDMVKSL